MPMDGRIGRVVRVQAMAGFVLIRHAVLVAVFVRLAFVFRISADLGGIFALAPALAVSAGGTLDLVGVATDGLVLHNRFQDGQWRGFASTDERM